MGGFNAGLSSPYSLTDADFKLTSRLTRNPYYRKYTPLFRETFGDLTRWAVVSARGTLEDDALNFSASGVNKQEGATWVQTTGHSAKLTKTSTQYKEVRIEHTVNPTLDVTGQHMILKYYVHPQNFEDLAGVTVIMSSVNGGWVAATDVGKSGTSNSFRVGWRTRPFNLNTITSKSADPVFDPANVNKIQITFETYTGKEASCPIITFDFLEFFPKLTVPIPYMLVFDGGYINHKSALAYMSARGVRAQVYPSPDLIGNAGYMTVDDLKQVQAMGHIINFHERNTPPTGWETLTQTQRVESIRQSIMWSAQNGFVQTRGFSPLGIAIYHDEDILETLMPYFDYVFPGHSYDLVPWNPRIMGLIWDSNTGTLETEAIARANAIAQGTYMAIVVHGLTGAFTLANFKTMVDAIIADANVRIVDMPELIETNWYAATH